ncbi:formate C-acetyltransferase [Sporobacter termitidis DSM 10068]|uniref:Formate C-acetyltransferase n=1 Tax=Sporobacter termitidis DSM 10068 TaxID=1123282 RepID=A0A1M5XDH6_9FIRM|nr:pyruvate formate lyase family protein [Sporobacter termitidis]SHH97253.1 formate C-acetyltransferase [Sporobacter termitidis DSM 10068]
MSWTLKPLTDRVVRQREAYRDTQPEVCIARYRILTEFYMSHPELNGILRRAKAMREIFEKIPVRIDDDEVIVGAQSAKYRAGALYPENCVTFIKDEIGSGTIATRDIDPYLISDEDRQYINETIDYWLKGESTHAKTQAYYPEEYAAHDFNGVTMIGRMTISDTPVGHFVTGYDKAIRVGFKAIKEEAERKQAEILAQGMPGDTNSQYNFYRAVAIACDGMITLTKRYAALAREKLAVEKDPKRKKELELMVETLSWTMENPARNFIEALQCLYMYQTCLCLEANMHGITFGRVDQYLGDFLERDLQSGAITEDYAQELMDLFYLKVAEMNKPWSNGATQSAPGYTSGQMMAMGGVDKDGNDASNKVTYMMLQCMARLVLHDPPQSLRIHKNTPPELWEAAIETTKICGGIPTFENDDVIIAALMKRGLTLEDARNYSPIGCVEPGGNGNDWPACGGTGSMSYINLPNALLLAINDGRLPMPLFSPRGGTTSTEQVGSATGRLYEMDSFEQVKEAYHKQVEYFVRWHVMVNNNAEYVTRELLPLPVVSATMGGCMEKGKDVMYGGAKYNGSGVPGIGIGNVADSLFMIKHLCFDTKKCTTRELYDALLNNWQGYEDLQQYIKSSNLHYGNAHPEADQLAAWASEKFAEVVTSCTGPRGRYTAAMFPVTANVMFGMMTGATPDGRSAGTPLADGISPVQQMDKNGPTAVVRSVATIDQSLFANGTLLNMKFSPSCLSGKDGVEKLSQLIQTYFELGGMELQINVISAEILKDAQKNPENYKNLVVRVAGFSAYFVELHITGQNDLISRTVLEM